jgi:hypothetical protein
VALSSEDLPAGESSSSSGGVGMASKPPLETWWKRRPEVHAVSKSGCGKGHHHSIIAIISTCENTYHQFSITCLLLEKLAHVPQTCDILLIITSSRYNFRHSTVAQQTNRVVRQPTNPIVQQPANPIVLQPANPIVQQPTIPIVQQPAKKDYKPGIQHLSLPGMVSLRKVRLGLFRRLRVGPSWRWRYIEDVNLLSER